MCQTYFCLSVRWEKMVDSQISPNILPPQKIVFDPTTPSGLKYLTSTFMYFLVVQ